MKNRKRLLIGLGVVLAILLAAGAAAPFLFKDKILAGVKTVVNENINARFEFAELGLSFFKRFPDVSIRLHDFSVEGVGTFEGIRLVEGKTMEITIDLLSLFRNGPVHVQAIHLESPKAHVMVTEAGLANYDIVKPTEVPPGTVDTAEAATPGDYLVSMDKYTITNGSVIYDDASLGVYVDAKGINHNGKGDFNLSIYDLDTYTTVEELSVDYGGIGYLSKAKATLEAGFLVNQDSSKYTLQENDLLINELRVVGDGFFQLLDSGYNMDLHLRSPENEFRDLLSLIPGAYMEGYENVKADGQFRFNADIAGIYDDSLDLMPAYDIHLQVDNGNVKYPDLPLGISGINAVMDIKNPSNVLDSLTIDVPNLSLNIGRNPIDAVFHLRTPVSDPDVDADVDGILDLAELSKAFPMEGLKELSGKITADVRVKARMSQIDRQQYESVNMQGDLRVQGMTYRSADYPPVKIRDMQMTFSPKYVDLQQFDAKLGKSDIAANGRIDNILAYFSPKATMRGNIHLRSRFFDANEWMAQEETSQTAVPSAAAITQTPVEPAADGTTEMFTRFDFKIDAEMDDIRYDKYHIQDVVTRGRITPNRLNMEQASAVIGNSDISASGIVTDMYDYLFENGTLGGRVSLQSTRLDLNQFMSELPQSPAGATTSTSTAGEPAEKEYGVIMVPDNINLVIDAKIGEVNYTDLDIRDLSGNLEVADRSVALHDVAGQILGGRMGFNGLYNTQNEAKPIYSIKLDLDKMDFQRSFNALNTFKMLAPIGQFISGIFTTSFLMEGSLGSNMMPNIQDITAKGFLETVNAVVKGFKPLEAVANSLNIKELKDDIRLIDTKNWIEVKEGSVEVKPFDLKVQDINLTVAGTHAISQDMDYNIKARIPRKKFEKNYLGAQASAGLRQIQQQASKFGINIAQGEYVNVLINLTGNIKDPKVAVKLLGMDGQTPVEDALKESAAAELEKQKQALEQKAQQELSKVTEKAKETVGKAVDSLKYSAQQELEKKKSELESKAKETITKEVGEKLSDTLSKEAQKQVEKVLDSQKAKQEVDKMKKELEKFNPFKKKPTTDTTSQKSGGN